MNLFTCTPHPLQKKRPEVFDQTIIVMKLIVLLTILCCFKVSASVYAQKISIDVKNVPIETVFDQIKKQSGYTFWYKDNVLEAAKKVTIKLKDFDLKPTLEACLKDQPLTYEISGKIIVIKPKTAERDVSGLKATKINGKVLDEKGQALAGVNIRVKGTEKRTATNDSGIFSIEVPAMGSVLQFSFMGYETLEYTVKDESTVNISLKQVSAHLESVVVVGYGTQKKRDVTSAISSVKGEELTDRPVAGVTNLLQGKVSGLNITSDGGEPGGASKVRIRGIGTLTNNDPLYIVDGIPVNGGLYNLNPNDIASVEVLKDAAAAAIYGSRAANGVVYVTTKKGRSGKTDISFDAYFGTSDLVNYYKMAGADEYYKLKTIQNGGIESWKELRSKGYNTNWADALLRKGTVQNYNASISGGGEKFKFFTSAGFIDQEGVQKKSDYQRLNVRFNSDYIINKRLKFSSQLNVSNETRHGFNALYSALTSSPIAPIYKTQAEIDAMSPADREYNQFFDVAEALNFGSNTVAALARSNGASSWLGLNGNVSGNLEIIKDLNFTSTFGIEDSRFDSYSFSPKYALGSRERNDNTSASAAFSKSFHWTWNNILQYNRTLGEKHHLGLMVGLVSEQTNSRNLNGSKSKGLGNEEHQQVIDAMSDLAVVGGGRASSAMESYVGRFNYNYADKYLLQATMRRDGTYRFAKNNRWGNFPSVSVGWRLSDEEFFKGLDWKWAESIKLRASWGQLGNEQISEFQYMSIIEGAAKRGYTLGGVGGADKTFYQGYGPTQVSNPNLKWETTEATNLGFDASFLEGKLTLQFDWFRRLTKDVLYKQNLPAYVGAPNAEGIENGSVFVNGGTIQNTGFDIELAYKSRIGEVGVNASANFSHYKNLLKSLGNYNQPITVSDERVNEVIRMLPGDPLGGFYGYVVEGFYQTQAEVDAGPEKGKKPGDFRYADLNHDGKIDDTHDRKIIGNPNPKFAYGFNLGFDYKGFDLNTFWQGVYGNDIYNLSNLYLTGWSEGTDSWNYVEGYLNNSWQKAGDNPKYPKVGRYYTNYINPNTASIEKGSYLRLKNVQLGYNLPEKVISKLGLSGLRIYLSGENLLVFTNYSGNDPEIGNGITLNSGLGGRSGSPSYVSGIDYANQYPISKTYTLGINVKF